MAHRITDQYGLASKSLRKSGVSAARKMREDTIGESGYRILLMNQQRSAQQPGGQTAGAAGKTTQPHHQLRVHSTNHSNRLLHSTQQSERSQQPTCHSLA